MLWKCLELSSEEIPGARAGGIVGRVVFRFRERVARNVRV